MACDTIRLANLIRNGAKVLRIILLLPNDALIQPLCFFVFSKPINKPGTTYVCQWITTYV